MVQKLFIDVEDSLRRFCAERSIPISAIRFFGSRTKESIGNEESDLDLLLVSEVFNEKDIFERADMVCGLHRSLVKRFRIPFDIMYCSDKEWQSGNSLLLNELRRGSSVANNKQLPK